MTDDRSHDSLASPPLRPAPPDRLRLAGTAGSCRAAPAARAAARRLPQQSARGGQSAVIDVNRARTDPIPIAIPTWAAATVRRRSSARTSPASSPTTWPQRPVPPDRSGRRSSRRGGAGRRRAELPELEARSARRRWSPAASKRRAADRSAWSSACGTCCRRQQIQGTAYTTTPGQLAAHRPHHGRRDLRAAAGREGLFRHPHRLHRRPPDRATGAPSGWRSWTRTARTTAS